jgi:hypothetical protein
LIVQVPSDSTVTSLSGTIVAVPEPGAEKTGEERKRSVTSTEVNIMQRLLGLA